MQEGDQIGAVAAMEAAVRARTLSNFENLAARLVGDGHYDGGKLGSLVERMDNLTQILSSRM